MKITLRQKMNMIVCTVAATFVFLMVTSWYLNLEMENQTLVIRDKYIPLVEVGYRLETQFENIGFSLRDAVQAQDLHALETSEELKNKFLRELDTATNVIEPQQIQSLKTTIDDYFTAARDTSERLIKGETGLPIVESMVQMQSKRAAAAFAVGKVTNFDRTKLRDAFSSIAAAQQRSARIRFWVSLCSVVFIFAVAIIAGRAIMSRLQVISSGLDRFGEGDFSKPIPVVGHDELSELSTQVNMMAARIQSLVREIESFSYSVAHDLRAPVRSVMGFSNALLEDYAQNIPDEGKAYLQRITNAAQRMGHMIDGLLGLSRLNRTEISRQQVNLSKCVLDAVETLRSNDPEHKVTLEVAENVYAFGDPKLLDVAISNLVNNAWKFSKRTPGAKIQMGTRKEDQHDVYFVRDNGAGFDMRYSDKLFGTFQRLHSDTEFEGHGIGLATVKHIIDKHGGRIWAESEINKGTTFYFTLG